jgi:CRISPR system Cascade subunit CasE
MFLSQLLVNTGDDPDRPQPGRQWLSNIYRVHQRLWMAFPDKKILADDPYFLGAWGGPLVTEPKPARDKAGFLFRIERDGKPRILVQSAQRPSWAYAFQNAPYLLADEPKFREFDPTPCRDHAYRFRLLANVVQSKSVAHSDGSLRKTRAIPRRRRKEILIHPDPIPNSLPPDPVEREQLIHDRWNPWRKWLQQLGTHHGFRFVDEKGSPLLMQAIHTVVRHPKCGGGLNGQDAREKRYNAGLFEGVIVCTSASDLRNSVINGVGHAKAFGFGLLSLAPLRPEY